MAVKLSYRCTTVTRFYQETINKRYATNEFGGVQSVENMENVEKNDEKKIN